MADIGAAGRASDASGKGIERFRPWGWLMTKGRYRRVARREWNEILQRRGDRTRLRIGPESVLVSAR